MTNYLELFAGTSGLPLKNIKVSENIVEAMVFASEDNRQVLTTSLIVAKVFQKEHRHVLRDIRELIESDEELRQSNFGLSFIIRELPNGGSKREPIYVMDKDGFTILVMGYTGKKALQFKKAYIKAFNTMEAELRKRNTPKLPDFLNRYILNENRVPHQYISVINVMYTEIYRTLEHIGCILPDKSIKGTTLTPDISIGKGFAKYLRDKGTDLWRKRKTYIHTFGDGRSYPANMYPKEAYPLLIDYIHEEWLPKRAYIYLKDKAPEALQYLPKLLN